MEKRGSKYGLVRNTCLDQYSIFIVYDGYTCNMFTLPVWTSRDWSQSCASTIARQRSSSGASVSLQPADH